MKLQLSSSEILKAVQQYVGTLGINLTDKTVKIEFVKRQNYGLMADVDITDENELVAIEAGGTLEISEPEPEQGPESIDGSQSIFS